MAISGSVSTNSYDGRYLTCTWSATQSIANNTSTISWTLKGAGTGGSSWYYSGPIWIGFENVGGGNIWSNTYWTSRQKLYNGTVVATGSFTITHNNDGTRKFNIFIEGAIYTSASNVSGNTTVTLDAIPRYANPVPALTARTETSLTIGWTADGIVDSFQYSIDNGSTWSAATDPESTTGSFTVSGLTADTGYDVILKARRKDSQLTNQSTATEFSTYSYPYAETMPDFIIGNSVTLGLFNPLGRTVTVTMDGATGSTSTTTLTLTPTAATLYALIPNAKSGTYSVSVTYSGHTLTKTGGQYKVDENANKPVIGAFAYADSNNTATAITLDNQKIVQNISTPLFTGSGLVAQNSATLATVSVEVNGATYTNSSPSGTTNVQGGVINSTTDVIATLTVTDSRGITNTKTVNVSMIPWTQPSAIITVERQANFYSETDMTVDASYTEIGSSTITISVLGQAVPIAGQVTPSDVTATLTDNVQSTVLFDNNFAWNIAITLTDSFGGSTTYNTYISRGIPETFFDRYRRSMSLNGFPTHDNSVEIFGGDYYKDGNPIGDEFVKQTDLPLSVSDGGTGQSSIPAFLNAISTEYTDSGTVTGETRRTKTWTVSGSGILFVFGMTACDTTNSYGSTIVEIKRGSTVVAGEHARTDTRSGAAVTVSAATMLKVTNGTTITVEGYSTKGGTKTVTARAMAFGCTLS